MNTDTKKELTPLVNPKGYDNDPIPQDNEARKAWFDEAWAERERNGLE